jgi:hypothetical protein
LKRSNNCGGPFFSASAAHFGSIATYLVVGCVIEKCAHIQKHTRSWFPYSISCGSYPNALGFLKGSKLAVSVEKKKCFRLGHIKLRSEFRNRFFSMTFNEKFDPDKQYKHQGRTLSKSPLRTYSSLSIRAVGRITVQSVGLAEEISFFRVNRWRCKPGRGD